MRLATAAVLACALGVALISSGCGDDSSADDAAPADAGAADARTCSGSADCDDNNPCTADTCADGLCDNPADREGEPCNDGVFCSDGDVCAAGECVGEARDCSALDDFCNTGVCDEDADSCVARPAANGTTCDDGVFCTDGDSCVDGECAGVTRDCSSAADQCNTAACDEATAACVPEPVADGIGCEDGVFCTIADSCQAGTCIGGSTRSCADGDACTTDSCSLAADECSNVPAPPIPGGEGPTGDATCGDTLDNDCDGAVDSADTDCIDCTTDPECDDGNQCTADSCNGLTCDNTPLTGSACEDGLACTVGDSCSAAGACVPGAVPSCNDGNACTVDRCDEATSGCRNDVRAADPASFVGATGTCVVAGSSARVVVWTELVDAAGAPLTGASVTIGGVIATASTAQPGTYFAEIVAGGAPATQLVQVVATACGATVTLITTVALTHDAPNATSGGTGGCSPSSGNLRVRVIAAETGAPIEGASVLIGLAQATPFERSPAALFGGASSPGTNVLTTDGAGVVQVFDYGAVLASPIAVTAGATGRAYFTVARNAASDVVVALPLLQPPPIPVTRYDMGTATASVTNCDNLDAGLLLPKLPLEFFSDLDLSRFFSEFRCWSSENSNVGTVAVPGNLWIPQQRIGFLCLGGQLQPAPWELDLPNTAATGVTENVALDHVRIPVADVQAVLSAGGGFTDLLLSTTYRGIGFLLDESVPTAPTSGRSIPVGGSYSGNTFTVTYSGQPAQTDVMGFSLADYSGARGSGPLFIIGHEVHEFDQAGSTVPIPNASLGATPANPWRLASVTALYLDPDAHPSVDVDRRTGRSSVLIREDAMGNPPFGESSGSTAVSSFLDIAGQDYTSPSAFQWDNATRNGNVPMYSRHELAVRTQRYLPVLSCDTENDIRTAQSAQWIVVLPFGLDCGGQDCFTLPTLPASFPRAATSTQKKSGFDALIGSGAACTGPTGCAAGETCIDPDATGPAIRMCMGGSGTAADPYLVQDYRWDLHVYDLGLAPTGWSFQDFELSTHRRDVTHESANRRTVD